nr:MAG TPA: hypothetical protein [Caudoviricetes sp.]
MEKRVTKIYNACWKNYKEYLADHDMAAYNKRSEELFRQYGGQYDIQNLLFWFAPIVNKLHAEYLKEMG